MDVGENLKNNVERLVLTDVSENLSVSLMFSRYKKVEQNIKKTLIIFCCKLYQFFID